MSERLEALQKKKEQLENQIKTLKSQEKQKERKARTHRLIEIGAIFETRLGIKTVEEATQFCDKQLTVQSKPD